MSDKAATRTVLSIMGHPGTGKSTVARELGEILGLPTVHSGQLLRNLAATSPDSGIRAVVNAEISLGNPISVDLFCTILHQMAGITMRQGAIFDNYPKSVEQCQRLNDVLDVLDLRTARVIGIFLNADRDTAIERQLGRRVCASCHENIWDNVHCCPRMTPVRRPDDNLQRAIMRYDSFASFFGDLQKSFGARWPFHNIDANLPISRLVAEILSVLQT